MQNTRFENIEYRLKNSSPETRLYGFLQHALPYMCIFSADGQIAGHGQYFVFDTFPALNSRSVTVQQLGEEKKNVHCPSYPFPRPLLSVIAHSETTQTAVSFFAKKSDWITRGSITMCRTYTWRFFYRRFFTQTAVYGIEFD